MTDVATIPDQRVVLRNASWATYERLLAEREEARSPRFAYDHGELEIVSPFAFHEAIARLVTHLVGALVEAWELDVTDLGSNTFKDEDWGRGFEPDACFYVREAASIRGVRRIDPRVHPPPDIVFEVDVSTSSLNKLPIYAQFGVPEVWRHDGERLTILILTEDTSYAEAVTSGVFPALTSHDLTRFLAAGLQQPLPAWLATLRAWARHA